MFIKKPDTHFLFFYKSVSNVIKFKAKTKFCLAKLS